MPRIIVDEKDDDYGRHHHHHQHRRHYSRWRACFPCCAYRKPRFHSRARYHFAAVLSFVVLLAAFVLYLLPALSLPILKPVYLLQVNFATAADQPATSIATNLRFGVWGFCASSVLDLPTILTNDGECTAPRLGYDIPADVLSLIGFPPSIAQDLLEALKLLLVLHPIVAGFALVTLALAALVRWQAMTICALIAGVMTAILGSVVRFVIVLVCMTSSDHDRLVATSSCARAVGTLNARRLVDKVGHVTRLGRRISLPSICSQ